jgi:hypothetical protein
VGRLPRGGLYIRNDNGFFWILRVSGEYRDVNAQLDDKRNGRDWAFWGK